MPDILFLDKRPATPPTEQPAHPPRVAFVTLGCKVNQSDTQKAIADFRAAGWRIVPPTSPAEVYIVNTCSVTHVADRKSRQWLRRSAHANPSALIVATGCYAESGRSTLEQMDEVGLIVGYKHKDDLLALVQGVSDFRPSTFDLRPSADPWPLAPDASEPSRTRAMIKIEDGCNDFCT